MKKPQAIAWGCASVHTNLLFEPAPEFTGFCQVIWRPYLLRIRHPPKEGLLQGPTFILVFDAY